MTQTPAAPVSTVPVLVGPADAKAAAKAAARSQKKSDVESEVAKYEKRVANMKHIDAKSLAIDYMFPLLRLMAEVTTDQDGQIGELAAVLKTLVDGDGGGEGDEGDDIVDLLEDVQEIVLRLAAIVDQFAVAGGFVRVTKAGASSTGVLEKTPEGRKIMKEYMKLLEDVPDIVTDLAKEIEGEGEEGDEGEGEEGTALEPDGVSDPGTGVRAITGGSAVDADVDAANPAAGTGTGNEPAGGATADESAAADAAASAIAAAVADTVGDAKGGA